MKNIVKEINFIPVFVIEERKRIARMIRVAIITAVITLAGFAIYFLPDIQISILKDTLRNYDTELNYLDDIKKIERKLKEVETKLTNKKKILEEINKEEVDIIFLIDKLSSARPPNVILTYLSIDKNKEVNVSYIVNNPVEATQLVNNLINLNIFEKVELPSIPLMDKKTDISFKLKLKTNSSSEKTKK